MAAPVLLGRGGRVKRQSAAANYPLFGTLNDSFVSQDAVKWNGFYGGSWPVVSAGQLQIPAMSSYNFVQSAKTYRLTGSGVRIKAVEVPKVGDGTPGAYMQLVLDSNNILGFACINGKLDAYYTSAGTSSDLNLTYNATTHAWWRIRELGGTVFWDTSADGSVWTNRRKVAAPISTAALTFKLMSGFYGSTAAPGTFIVDNVNITGGGGSANPIGVFDYQTGDFSQYQALDKDTSVSQASRFAIVTTPARTGFAKTAKYTLVPSDNDPFNDPNCQRTEAVVDRHGCGNIVAGDEQWWAFSTYFPADFNTIGVPWMLYHEYHHTYITGNPNVAFFLSSGTANPNLSVNFWGGAFPRQEFNYNTGSLGAMPKGQWVDHLMYFKWHTDPALGRFGLWLNGVQKVAPTTAVSNMYTGQMHPAYGTGPMSIYMEQGIYRGKPPSNGPTHVIHFTGTRWGSTRASVEM